MIYNPQLVNLIIKIPHTSTELIKLSQCETKIPCQFFSIVLSLHSRHPNFFNNIFPTKYLNFHLNETLTPTRELSTAEHIIPCMAKLIEMEFEWKWNFSFVWPGDKVSKMFGSLEFLIIIHTGQQFSMKFFQLAKCIYAFDS